MKTFGSIITIGGLLLAACSTTPPAEEWPETGKETVESAQATAEQAGESKSPHVEALQSLDAQRRTFLRNKHLELANKLIDQLKFEAARDELVKASRYAPDDLEVKRRLAFVLEQLGDRAGAVTARSEDMIQIEKARYEQLRTEAEATYTKAKEHFQFKEFDQAIQSLNEVLMHIELGQDRVDYGDLETRAKALLDQVNKEKNETLAKERARQEKRVFAQLREKERRNLRQRALRIDSLWKTAFKAMERDDYESVLDLCEEILLIDPTNQNARNLADMAEKARLDTNERSYVARRKEEFRKWRNSLAASKIPWGSDKALIRPTREEWRDITQKRRRMAGLGLAEEADPADKKLEEKLDSMTIKGTFPEGTPFTEAVNYLTSFTGLPVVLTPAAREQLDMDQTEVDLNLTNKISVRSYLNLLMKRNQNLAYQVQDGLIYITTKEGSFTKYVVRVHSIADLTFGLTSFSPPKIDEIRVGTGGGMGGMGMDQGGPMGGVIGEPVKTVDPDSLTTMIRDTVAVGTWESGQARVEALPNQKQLLVIHTPEVQQKIIQYLDDLRRYGASIVTIKSKFLTVSENYLQQVGVEWRGLGGEGDNPAETEAQLDDLTQGLDDNTSLGYDNSGTGVNNDPAAPPTAGFYYDDGGDGDARARTEHIFPTGLGSLLSTKGGATVGISILDDLEMRALVRLVEKNIAFQLVNSQELTVMNTQRANVTMVQQVSYVKDFDVEVAQAAFIADPQVDILQDGIVLDVRPTIAYDRKYIALELRPTVAELVRPIPTFTSSLAGSTLAVTIQLPELNVRTINTTVTVPDGGTVLIGGLKQIHEKERKAETPWLGSLPILSLLFKSEGRSEENESLMIMVQAYITDISEAMKGY